MELVHIIFSIMTVAFITTFLLISFSYLSYKIKERKKLKSNLNLQPVLINPKSKVNKNRFEAYNKLDSNYDSRFEIMNFTIYNN